MINISLGYKQIKDNLLTENDKNMVLALFEHLNSSVTGLLQEDFLVQFHYLIVGMYGHLPKHGNYISIVQESISKIIDNKETFIHIKCNDGNPHLIYPSKENLTI